MPGYMYDDKDDDIEGLQTSGRCMARALGFLLEEKEGIIIELPFQEDYPDDPYGFYSIHKEDGQIRVTKIEKDTLIWNNVGEIVDLEKADGQMIYLDDDFKGGEMN